MKKLWVPLFVLFLLPALYSVERTAERMEDVRPPDEDSIRSQTEEPAETILYFPDYVDGGGWSVQLALSNVDADTGAEAVVEVYDEFGGPILDLFDSGSAFEIPPLGSRVLRSSGTGEIRRGWIQVRTGTASVSGLLTYKQGTTGIEVSVEPAELGDRFALFVEESGDVGAGVAIFKPEAASSIQLRVRDEAGNDPLEGAFVSRGNFHQSALTLPEWFDAEGIDRGFLTDFRGLLLLRAEDESTVRSARAAVREEEPFALVGSRNRGPGAGSTGGGPLLPGLRGWKRLVRAVGAQQRRRGDGRRGQRGSLRQGRTADSGSVRVRIGVRDPVAGQPGAEERGRGGDPARLDQGRVRSGVGQWVVDLPAGRDGSRGQRETGGVGKPVRPVRGGVLGDRRRSWPSSNRTPPRTSSSESATRRATTR